jgi:hypothetical protein
MAAVLVTTAQYPAVRAAIDVTLTADALPDSVIGLTIFAGKAERDAIARATNGAAIVASTAGDDFDRLRDVAILLCAALVVPALPQITQESVGQRDYEYRAVAVDPLKRAAQLRAEAAVILAALNGTRLIPTQFTLATGGRAQSTGAVPTVPAGTIVAGVG